MNNITHANANTKTGLKNFDKTTINCLKITTQDYEHKRLKSVMYVTCKSYFH